MSQQKRPKTKKRTIEYYTLTISGLPKDTDYWKLIHNIVSKTTLEERERKYGEDKTDILFDGELRNGQFKMRFATYSPGIRPDVIDTTTHQIEKSPYKPTQTNLRYTHILGIYVSGQYYILLEKSRDGIWASNLGDYLHWFLEQYSEYSSKKLDVNIEPLPSEKFGERLNALDTISEASIRIVRPNPGWDDLETELGNESKESDSSKTEIKMQAGRNKSLSKNGGIVKAIRDRLQKGVLRFAKVKGKGKDQKIDEFSTEKLLRTQKRVIPVDTNGQINSQTAWNILEEIAEELSTKK
jgi:hypothetical protein